jgi:hypothetical protein
MIDIVNKKINKDFNKGTLLYYWNVYNSGEADNFLYTYQDTGDGCDWGYGECTEYRFNTGNGGSRIK